jgi:broad specificity phosphatase PhoE
MSATVPGQAPAAPPVPEPRAPALPDSDYGLRPEHVQDAHRDVLLAVQRGLAAGWEHDHPRVAVVDHNDIATIYVSTIRALGPEVRSDLRDALRAAIAPYVRLAPSTNVVFLRRGMA